MAWLPALDVVVGEIREQPMNIRATYNDFLYAITVGSAISIIKDYSPGASLFGAIVLMMVVLQDLYEYKTVVAPEDAEGRHYTLKSLYFELAILFSWYGSFYQWVEQKYVESTFWLALFWAAKALAGFSFYRKAQSARLQKMAVDSVFLLPMAAWGVNWWLPTVHLGRVWPAFGFIVLTWGGVSFLFRFLRWAGVQGSVQETKPASG